MFLLLSRFSPLKEKRRRLQGKSNNLKLKYRHLLKKLKLLHQLYNLQLLHLRMTSHQKQLLLPLFRHSVLLRQFKTKRVRRASVHIAKPKLNPARLFVMLLPRNSILLKKLILLLRFVTPSVQNTNFSLVALAS